MVVRLRSHVVLAGKADAAPAARRAGGPGQGVARPAKLSIQRRSEMIAMAWPDCCSASASLIVCPKDVCVQFGETFDPTTR